MKPLAIILVGISGSTKSTWAETQAWKLRAGIVNMDNIREALCGNASDQSKNQQVFDEAIALWDRELAAGHNQIWDATSVKPRSRQKVIEIAKKHGAKVIGVYFKTDLVAAKLRNASRDRKVPNDIIDHQFTSLTAPSFEEGFDELQTMNVDSPDYKPCLL